MIDLVLDATGDLLIENGDLAIGEVTLQNQALILVAQPGEFKQSPNVGVGISDLVLGTELLEYRHAIRQQFTADGMRVNKIDLYNIDNFHIDATYHH